MKRPATVQSIHVQLEPSGVHPLSATHAFAVHLIALHPHFWDATVMREYKTHKHFSMPFRVDGPSSADLGIALLSHDGGSISAISLVEWSPSALAGKRRAKFLDITLLPPVSLAELGQPRATIVDLLVLSDDRCDAGTRDVAASSWPSLRESLCRRDSRWFNAITMIELHLWFQVVERGDGARVVALLDRGADPNAYLERTEQLETGESVKLYRTETVTRRETVLERAVRCGCRGVAEILLERGALASADALGHAVRGNDAELVRRLLDRGADPNGLVWTTEHVQEYYGYDSGEVTVHLRVPAVVLASQVGNHALFLLLVAAGGRPGKEVSTRC